MTFSSRDLKKISLLLIDNVEYFVGEMYSEPFKTSKTAFRKKVPFQVSDRVLNTVLFFIELFYFRISMKAKPVQVIAF